MTKSRVIETVVGVFVVIGLLALVAMALQVSNLSGFGSTEGYSVQARFENIGGLKVRSAVKMSGVKVGEVSGIELDPGTYEAVVTLSIDPRYDEIPADTTAEIYTAGLLGEQYVALSPGGDDLLLEEGGDILITSSAVVLEQVISRFLYNKAAGE